MKIGVIGGGIVGRAVARTYIEFATVLMYDILPERCTIDEHTNKRHTTEEVLDSDLVFVCLPTNMKQDDPFAMDLSAVEGFFGEYGCKWSDTNFVLKSTVPIGTCRRIREYCDLTNLVHSPEFLTARCAVTDAIIPSRNIVGGIYCECGIKLYALYHKRFPGIVTHMMTSDESEAVKLFCNAFFATKVGFFNEINTLCNRLDLDWQHILMGMLSDGRISHSHTQVPGPDGRRGFGGSCLPKDLLCLVKTMEGIDLQPGIMRSVFDRNEMLDRNR